MLHIKKASSAESSLRIPHHQTPIHCQPSVGRCSTSLWISLRVVKPWKKDVVEIEEAMSLATETVEGAALSLECVDNVEGGDSLALGVLGVCDGVADNTLEEGLEDTTGLFVDHCEARQRMLPELEVFAGESDLLAEIRLTPPRRARRRIAGLVIPWMLSRKILR